MSLFSSLGISGSGMAAQRARAELLVENLANAETTRTPQGGPYRRKDVVFRAVEEVPSFASAFAAELVSRGAGVRVDEVVVDQREPLRRHVPGHPDADAEGYVAFPRVDPAEDTVNLMGASRGYQANVAAIAALKDMIHRSIDLLR